MQANGVQQPLFAPSSQGAQGDDFDLNEIFADYFMSEFDDPLNAYTNSMANYSGAAAAMALAQKQHEVNVQAVGGNIVSTTSTLPTGGIKTAFHAAQASTGINAAYHPAQVAILEPAEKKTKIEAIPPHVGAKMPPVTNEPMAPGGSGLSSRLGFSYPVAQTVPPQTQSSLAASQNSQLSNQQTTTAGVALPVGVGIRLGGVGGVAPATAAQARPGGQYTMWGGPNAGGVVSEQAVAERRQRNREHAKRSRVRKKFMLESLQEQVMSLQKENVELRMLIQEKIPEHAQQIIAECCNNSTVFTDPGAADSGGDSKSDKDALLDRSDVSLMESLSSSQQNFVLSDPRLPDNPIVYASPGFYKLTGYTQDQVLGRNCRFLQGPGTDPRHIDIIRKAVAIGSDATVCLLNYKADGTPFWNQFFIAALRDSDNCIVNFVGVQCEVEPEAGMAAIEEKVNSVMPLQNKEEGGEKAESKDKGSE